MKHETNQIRRKILPIVVVLGCIGFGAALLLVSPFVSKNEESASEKLGNANAPSRFYSSGEVSADASAWQRFGRGGSRELTLSEDAEIRNELSNLVELYENKEDQSFLEKIHRLIEAKPTVPEYRAVLADYYYNEGDWKKAESVVRDLVELDPKNDFAKVTLGELIAIQGRFEDAEAVVREVLDREPTNSDALHAFVSINQLKETEDYALGYLRDLNEKFPQNGEVAVIYSDLLSEQKRFDERQAVLKRAAAQNPRSPGPLRALALDASRAGDHRDAYSLAMRSLDLDRDSSGQIRSLDIMYLSARALGDRDRAASALRRILEINPNDSAAREQLEALGN